MKPAVAEDVAFGGVLDAARAIPEATVARLTGYLRVLAGYPAGAGGTISSEELATLAGVNPAKLRKDLSYVGTRGTRGVGYELRALQRCLERTLGAHEVYPVAIAGVGHLGSALAGYGGFAGRGLPVRALFDADPRRIGTVVAGLKVADIALAQEVCAAASIAIGVIATPEAAAQQVADLLVAAGVGSILNFAPARLTVPGGVQVRRVDVALELQLLAFHESRRGRPPGRLEAL